MEPDIDIEQQWRDEVSALPIPEILGLAYTFRMSKERLILYLDVLRSKASQQAQFAASLICFDLARQGLQTFQREFMALAPTIVDLSQNKDFLASLIGENDYLEFLWELCEAQLEVLDSEQTTDHVYADEAVDVALDLFDDQELDEFDIEVDIDALHARYSWALGEFLGYDPDFNSFDFKKGYRAGGRKNIARIETFLTELDSLRKYVPVAQALRAITLLFFATGQKSKDFWGRPNTRKKDMLLEGLGLFRDQGALVASHINLLTGRFADEGSWQRVMEQLLHFVRWSYRHGMDWTQAPQTYDPDEALPALPDMENDDI